MPRQFVRGAPHFLFVVDPLDSEAPGFFEPPSLQVLWRFAFAETRAVPLAARSRSGLSLRSKEVFPSPSENRRAATPQRPTLFRSGIPVAKARLTRRRPDVSTPGMKERNLP